MQTPGNLLFVGCSHSNGFWSYTDNNSTHKEIWDKNNYAQIYAEQLADSRCFIYSSAGATNQKYAKWIRHMLNIHPEIKGVVLQSTYWDRWLMACNLSLKFETLDTGYFTRTYAETEKYILYDDFNTIDYSCIEWNEKIKWDSVGQYDEGYPEVNGGYNWVGFDTNYMHMKTHTEIITHLKHDEYCKDIALIDAMCDIPVYIWRINEAVQFPDRFDLYKTLNNVKVFHTPADKWIQENLNININSMKQDQEHFNFEAHDLIARNFIPEILNGSS